MGKVNDAFNDYLNNPIVFADLCNGLLYEGKRVIMPEELAEFQKFYQEDMRDRAGGKKKVRRERDVAKLLCRKDGFIIIAVENQDEEHLYMPLRCLEYELEDLKRQIRRIKRRYDRRKDLRPGAEFLSGIRQSDRFIPTVTILVYHGKGKWNAAERLQELMDLSGADETLRKLLADYRLRIYNLTDLDETCREQGRRINMCKAFDDWAKEEQKKGEVRGRREGKKEGKKEGEKRLAALMDRLLGEGRLEDAKKAAISARTRQKLYLEYGI